MMSNAKPSQSIQLHYRGRLSDGEVFEDTYQGDPVTLTLGDGALIPYVEKAVVGMMPGERKTIVVPCVHAFGPHLQELVVTVGRQHFPVTFKPVLGDRIRFKGDKGQLIVAEIVAIDEAGYTLDSNHPLCGEDLIFDLYLVGILS